jgi:RND family efflux transporter MFP subunit
MHKARKVIATAATALAAAAVVLIAMLWLSGRFRSDQIEPGKIAPAPDAGAATTRNSALVELISRPHETDVVGSVQSELRTTISARLVANIVELKVRAGDHVAAGDTLVRLDDRDVRARVEQARESLRAAEAVYGLAKIEVDRLTPMVEQKVASSYELDQWKSKSDAAGADVLRAQQAIKEAEVALSDTRILAPFNGLVIDRQAEPGDLAAPGRPLLSLYDPGNLRLEASLRESYIGHLRLGQEIPVTIDALREERMGRVEEIVPAADPASRTFLVKLHLANAAGLYPGMFARMRVPLEEQEQLVIPAGAVDEVGQLDMVTVVPAETAPDARPERRSIRLGHRFGDRVEVLAGLKEGERVVLR